jgi:hypothetical protein
MAESQVLFSRIEQPGEEEILHTKQQVWCASREARQSAMGLYMPQSAIEAVSREASR